MMTFGYLSLKSFKLCNDAQIIFFIHAGEKLWHTTK